MRATLPGACDELTARGAKCARTGASRGLRCLTFELTGTAGHGTLAARRMMRYSASRPGCHAVACPVERRVSRH